MRRKLAWVMLLSAVIVLKAIYTGNALATVASGFTGTTLAVGRFGEINVLNHFIPPNAGQEGQGGINVLNHPISPNGRQAGHRSDLWLSWQKTKGLSDLYVQSNVWLPGGSTGWHTHPGHSLIIVTAGAVTAYDGDDRDCKPTVYTQGMGFIDAGGDHVHNLRNEGAVEARTVAVQLIPADAVRRIDVENPGNCSF